MDGLLPWVCAPDKEPDSKQLLKTFPLSSLKLGSQSANGSILSVHVDHSSKKLTFFVDNRPWSKVFPRSRSAHLLTMMIHKSLQRQSPFANRSRMARLSQQLSALEEEEFCRANTLQRPATPRLLKSLSLKGSGVHKRIKWQTLSTMARRLQAKRRALTKIRPPPRGLCGCVTFEVEWKNVHGILFQNFLQVDTVMALEVSQIVKREFDDLMQAQLWHHSASSSTNTTKGAHTEAKIAGTPDHQILHGSSPGHNTGFNSSGDWMNGQSPTPRAVLAHPAEPWKSNAAQGPEGCFAPQGSRGLLPRTPEFSSCSSTGAVEARNRQAYTASWLDSAGTLAPCTSGEATSSTCSKSQRPPQQQHGPNRVLTMEAWSRERAEAAAFSSLDEVDLQELEECLKRGEWHSDGGSPAGYVDSEKRGDWWSTGSVASLTMKAIKEEEDDVRRIHEDAGRLEGRQGCVCGHCRHCTEDPGSGRQQASSAATGEDSDSFLCTEEASPSLCRGRFLSFHSGTETVLRQEQGHKQDRVETDQEVGGNGRVYACASQQGETKATVHLSGASSPCVCEQVHHPADVGSPWTFLSQGSVEDVNMEGVTLEGMAMEGVTMGGVIGSSSTPQVADLFILVNQDKAGSELDLKQDDIHGRIMSPVFSNKTALPDECGSALVFPELSHSHHSNCVVNAACVRQSRWSPKPREKKHQEQQQHETIGSRITSNNNTTTRSSRDSYKEKPTRQAARHLPEELDCLVYQNHLVHIQFSDLLLPGEIKQAVMADQRLLLLVEAGIPPWAILWQTMPGVCRVYRPWVRHAAMYAYVIVSLVTALIGLYDLYKNVPVLRETLARVLEPVLRALGSLDMATRLRYLGTILFLQNFQRACSYLLPLFRFLTAAAFWLSRCVSPIVSPLLLPIRAAITASAAVGNFFTWAMSSLTFALAGSIWGVVVGIVYLLQVVTQFLLEPCTATATFIAVSFNNSVKPILQLARLFLENVTSLMGGLWGAVVPFLRALPATSRAMQRAKEPLVSVAKTASSRAARAAAGSARHAVFVPSAVRILLQDLFAKVFKALGGIVRGLMAFIMPCIRHRTSLYRRVMQDCRRLRQGVQQRVITPAKGAAHGLKRRFRDSAAVSLLMDLSRISSSSSLHERERQMRRLCSRRETELGKCSGSEGIVLNQPLSSLSDHSPMNGVVLRKPVQLSKPVYNRSHSAGLRNRRVPARTPKSRSKTVLFQCLATGVGASGFTTPPSQDDDDEREEDADMQREEFLSPTAFATISSDAF